jgi:hypothetical protein
MTTILFTTKAVCNANTNQSEAVHCHLGLDDDPWQCTRNVNKLLVKKMQINMSQ